MIKKRCILLAAIMLINIALTGLAGSESNAAATRAAYLHAFYPATLTWQKDTEKYIDSLDSLSFAWSQVEYTDDLFISTDKSTSSLDFYFPTDYLSPVKYARSKGKSVQLSIYCDMSTAKKAFASDAEMKKLVDLVVGEATRDLTQNTDIGTDSTPSGTTGGAADISAQSSASTSSAVTAPSGETPVVTETPEAAKSGAVSFDGIVIDFEGLRDTVNGSANTINGKPISQCFDKFLQTLKPRLKAVNKKLFVAVNSNDNFDGYDYKTIASAADRMILMAHDYEPVTDLAKSEAAKFYEYDVLTPTKSPAPSNDVKHAVNAIKAKLGSSALCKKVLLQVAFDSAQWQYSLDSADKWDSLDSKTKSTDVKMTPPYAKIKQRIDNMDKLASNITNGYNNLLECPYMTYYSPTEKLFNIIVYENSTSMESKIRHASDAGFGGISVWALGNIPNYTDKSGIALKLNVWNRILQIMESKSFWTAQKPTGKIVRFADKKVEKVVRNAIEKPSGNLYESDLNEISRLKLPANTTSRLADLKYLKKLEYLEVSGNSVSDLTPLSSLTGLKALNLARNRIKSLKPLAKLTGLEVLSLNGNSITDTSPLSGLVKMKRLYLSENNISSVKPLAKLTNLRLLYLLKDPVKDAGLLKKLKCEVVF